MSRRTKIILGFIPLVLLLGLVFWFSANDSEDSSNQSKVVVKFIKGHVLPDLNTMVSKKDDRTINRTLSHIVRKTTHFMIYALMGVCSFGALWFIERRKLRFFSAVTFCFIYAVTDEMHQVFVPWRSGELTDVIMGTSGSVLGSLIASVITLAVIGAKALSKKGKEQKDDKDTQTMTQEGGLQ